MISSSIIEEVVVPTSVAAGTTNTRGNYLGSVRSLVVTGTFTGTFRLQASVDGTNWADASADITAPTVIDVKLAPLYRANVSAYTSGTPKAWLCGAG